MANRRQPHWREEWPDWAMDQVYIALDATQELEYLFNVTLIKLNERNIRLITNDDVTQIRTRLTYINLSMASIVDEAPLRRGRPAVWYKNAERIIELSWAMLSIINRDWEGIRRRQEVIAMTIDVEKMIQASQKITEWINAAPFARYRKDDRTNSSDVLLIQMVERGR